MKTDFLACLSNPVGFKGYAISNDKLDTTVPFTLEGQEYTLNHGTVLIAAITSCTNTSNPRYGICFWHHIQFDESANFDFLFYLNLWFNIKHRAAFVSILISIGFTTKNVTPGGIGSHTS